MESPDENAVTLSSYDDGVDAYIAGSSSEHPHALLALLMEVVTPGSRVLEIGSGPGVDAAHLRAAGYLVQATDGSDGFLAYLRASGWRAVRYNLDLDEPPVGDWDAVYANAVLHHLRRERLVPALARLRRTLHPEAVLVASVKTGRPDGWSSAKLDAPRWFTYWAADDLHVALDQAGWKIDLLAQRSGRQDDWLDVAARC